jgi:F-type H+-transporting ATPase subunit c
VILGKGKEKEKTICVERREKMFKKIGKKLFTTLSAMAAVLLYSPLALAADALPSGESMIKVIFTVGAMVGAGFAIGLGAIGAGAGIGSACSGACQAVGRNPGVQGKIMTVMLVGMAMAESVCIYALVVALILLYANPYMRFFLG